MPVKHLLLGPEAVVVGNRPGGDHCVNLGVHLQGMVKQQFVCASGKWQYRLQEHGVHHNAVNVEVEINLPGAHIPEQPFRA